jgi:hypothetical protein
MARERLEKNIKTSRRRRRLKRLLRHLYLG